MFLNVTILSGIGILLFSANDPLHFGDLSHAFLTMFQVMTLDSWSLIMFINMFGCDVIGYSDRPEVNLFKYLNI